MTSQFPQDPAKFGGFSSVAAEATRGGQSEARSTKTSDERRVLALEMIADQLALIHRDLCAIDDFARADPARRGPDPNGGDDARPVSANDDTSAFADEAALDPDVTRSTEQHYSVGGYRYTNLQHAIAQAKRARRAPEASE